MASPSKKRTLTEQKSTDVDLKKSSVSGDSDKKKEGDANENAELEEIDPFRTFYSYLHIKADALKKAVEYLPQEQQDLVEELGDSQKSVSMDTLLERLHAIYLEQSTQNIMDETRGLLDDILEGGSEGEDEEDMRALVNKMQTYIKKELTEVKNALNTEQYQAAFDKLFALSYVGCLELNAWYTEPSGANEKANVEEILQQIANLWTQMFSKSDKFLDTHLTLGDKHFIYAMMDSIHKISNTEPFSYKWTFSKPKPLAPESLKWSIEQAKYNAPIKTLADASDEDEDDLEDEVEDSGVEDEEDGAGQEGGEEEEEPTGPPSKKRKL